MFHGPNVIAQVQQQQQSSLLVCAPCYSGSLRCSSTKCKQAEVRWKNTVKRPSLQTTTLSAWYHCSEPAEQIEGTYYDKSSTNGHGKEVSGWSQKSQRAAP